MDTALLALASTSGSALVQAMTTDAWAAVRGAVARLLGRGDPRRETALLERLDASYEVVRQADPGAGSNAPVQEEARWSSRFEVLLEDEPGAAEPVRALLTLMEDLVGQHTSGDTVTQRISAGRDAYVAGRDQHIGRPGGVGQD